MIKLTRISRWDNLPDETIWIRPSAIRTITEWKTGSSLLVGNNYMEVRQTPEYILAQMEIRGGHE